MARILAEIKADLVKLGVDPEHPDRPFPAENEEAIGKLIQELCSMGAEGKGGLETLKFIFDAVDGPPGPAVESPPQD